MSSENQYRGRCFCGAVELRVVGEPAAMGYCHCESCRQWSASPLNAFTLWPPTAVTITRGADQLASFSKTARSIRKWCKICGGHVLTDHPGFGLIDVYAAVLPELTFKAVLHVNYADSALHLHDGLPKQRDFPAELGGTGELMRE
jgi:hypothetical protein